MSSFSYSHAVSTPLFPRPPVYTLFALFEYLVVFSNVAFHMTAFWDFGSNEVIVATPPEDKRY